MFKTVRFFFYLAILKKLLTILLFSQTVIIKKGKSAQTYMNQFQVNFNKFLKHFDYFWHLFNIRLRQEFGL